MNQQDWVEIKEEIIVRNELATQNNKLRDSSEEMGNELDNIAFHCQQILRLLGQDLTDENLKDTPQRMARYLTEFLNYDPGNHETAFSSITVDQIVIVRNIPFYSLCQHHLLPFEGQASVAYLTGSHVLGLSKIPRIVQKHAHKLQLQEKLAHDIADELERVLVDCGGVAVIIKAEHLCMKMRGIKSEGDMVTSVLRGQFREETAVRIEFFNLLNS